MLSQISIAILNVIQISPIWMSSRTLVTLNNIFLSCINKRALVLGIPGTAESKQSRELWCSPSSNSLQVRASRDRRLWCVLHVQQPVIHTTEISHSPSVSLWPLFLKISLSSIFSFPHFLGPGTSPSFRALKRLSWWGEEEIRSLELTGPPIYK